LRDEADVPDHRPERGRFCQLRA